MKFFISQRLNASGVTEYRCVVSFGHKPALSSMKKFGPVFKAYREASEHIRKVKP